MRREHYKVFLLSFILFNLPYVCYSLPYYGVNFSYTLIGKEPPTLNGYQLMLNYDPQCLQWRKFNIYFDGGFSHFWVTSTNYYRSLNIYSIAPVIRYRFKDRWFLHPYLEISIGLAYLTRTRLDNRNLGIHFAFQDRVGIGLLFGKSENINMGIHAVHYSNAHLSEHNSGITAPLVLDIGYRFH